METRTRPLVKDDNTGVIHYRRSLMGPLTYNGQFDILCTSRHLNVISEPYVAETEPTCKRCLAIRAKGLPA